MIWELPENLAFCRINNDPKIPKKVIITVTFYYTYKSSGFYNQLFEIRYYNDYPATAAAAPLSQLRLKTIKFYDHQFLWKSMCLCNSWQFFYCKEKE